MTTIQNQWKRQYWYLIMSAHLLPDNWGGIAHWILSESGRNSNHFVKWVNSKQFRIFENLYAKLDRPRIWSQLTSFTRLRCETPHRQKCIPKLRSKVSYEPEKCAWRLVWSVQVKTLLTLKREMAISTCVAVSKACATRTAFAAHSFLVVWRVTDVTGNWIHWFLLTANILLLMELLYTCIKRRGQEWKWFVEMLVSIASAAKFLLEFFTISVSVRSDRFRSGFLPLATLFVYNVFHEVYTF